MDDLRSVIAEMRTVASQGTLSFKLAGWADRLEAAQALQAQEGGDALAAAQENGAIGYIHCGQFGRYIEFFDGKDMKDFGEQFLYASPAQPSGFVLVPVEPTRKMCDDAVHAAVHGSHGSPWFPHAWRAALKAAAAPAPIEQEG